MDSYRLIINNYDLSSEVITTDADDPRGFTVVRSPKGKMTPTLVTSTSEYDSLVGTPSKAYPTIYEGRSFIAKGFPLYVSAPYDESRTHMPFAVITPVGARVSATPMSYSPQLEDYINGDAGDLEEENIENLFWEYPEVDDKGVVTIKSVGTGSREDVLTCKSEELKSKILIKSNKEGNKEVVVITTLGNEDLASLAVEGNSYCFSGFNGPNKSVNVTIEKGTNSILLKEEQSGIAVGKVEYYLGSEEVEKFSEEAKIAFIFAGSEGEGILTKNIIASTAVSESARNKLSLTSTEKVLRKDILAYIFPKIPTEDDIRITFADFNSMGVFGNEDIPSNDPKYTNSLVMTINSNASVRGSLDYGYSSDALYKGFTSVNDDYVNNPYISVYVKAYNNTGTQDINGYGSITLSGGKKYIEDTSAIVDEAGEIIANAVKVMNLGWQQATEDLYSDVSIFFDSERHLYKDESLSNINEDFLSLADTHPLSGYIYNYTIPKKFVDDAPVRSEGARYWNICNEAKISLSSSMGDNIWSPMAGIRAAMQCLIIRDGLGGVAPEYLNSNEMGGQLGIDNSVVLHYNYSSQDQKKLGKKNYNPVIKDNTYGIMVVDQKTSKAGATTDWSYIGHVCSFLLLESQIKTQVMIPQLGKANNPYYRELRAEQVNQLLKSRLTGSNSIWEWAEVDTSTNTGCNDEYAQKEKKFIINVKVKPYPYSEIVELNFTNYSDSTAITSNIE